jgi:hypothetical protein
MKSYQKILTGLATVGLISATKILPNQTSPAESKPISQHIQKGIKNGDNYLGGKWEDLQRWRKNKAVKKCKEKDNQGKSCEAIFKKIKRERISD